MHGKGYATVADEESPRPRRGYDPTERDLPPAQSGAPRRRESPAFSDSSAWSQWTNVSSEEISHQHTARRSADENTTHAPTTTHHRERVSHEISRPRRQDEGGGHHRVSSGHVRTTRPDPHANLRFRGAVTRTIGSAIIPGLGFIGTKAHKLGIITVAMSVVTGIATALFIASNPARAAGHILHAPLMYALAFLLALMAFAWTLLILGTYLVAKPARLDQTKRSIGAILVALLSAIVSLPLAIGSSYAWETAHLADNLFQSVDNSKSQTRPTLEKIDPWAQIPRVNILLLGGDSGESRDVDLGVRTDTIMVASIDTQTGDTTIIQIPRNLQRAQFASDSPLAPLYPNGYSEMINSIWNDVPLQHPEVFEGKSDYPGADALKWAVEGTTGLNIDYFMMLNIDGLAALIDAMGGVTVNVNFPIAKHGSIDGGDCGFDGFIPEGPNQHLNGTDAMWYGRSRCNDAHPAGPDFGRMRRQSCLVNAIIDQADPGKMVIRYEELAQAAGDMITTDIPQEHLSAIVELATRVQKSHTVSRISFVNGQNGFLSESPDIALMHQQVQQALDDTAARGEAKRHPAPTPEQVSSEAQAETEPAEAAPDQAAQFDPLAPDSTSQGQAPVENTDDVCGYHHEEFYQGYNYIYSPPPEYILTPAPQER